MLGLKRDRAGRPQGNRNGELGAQLRDLVAENKLPTTRIESLVGGVRDIVPQALPALPRVRRGLNLSHPYRSYARAFLRGSVWPRLYWARIRCLNTKTKREQPYWMAFGLPHEYVARLVNRGDMTIIGDRAGLDTRTLMHLQNAEGNAGIQLLPLGLWGDGAPCQWDRSESIETLSLNLPGQSGAFKQLRLPLVAFAKKQLSEHTWLDICEVLCWSLRALAIGIAPTMRHDNTPWLKSDCWRQRGHPHRASSPAVGVRAALVEVRADWAFHTAVFRLPAHNRNAGSCWLCPIHSWTSIVNVS